MCKLHVCRRLEVKKAWAVHLAEQTAGAAESDDEEEEEAAIDPEAVSFLCL